MGSFTVYAEVVVGGKAFQSNTITVDLDYSQVYPVSFGAGDGLDFGGDLVSTWLTTRLGRLTPCTGVNAKEKDSLTQIPWPDFDEMDYELAVPAPAFDSEDFYNYTWEAPLVDFPPVVTTTSTLTAITSSPSVPTLKDITGVMSEMEEFIKKLDSDFGELKSKKPLLDDAKNNYNTMIASWNDVKNSYDDLVGPDLGGAEQFEDYGNLCNSLKEASSATKACSESIKNVVNELNSTAKKYGYSTQINMPVKAIQGSLDKISDLTQKVDNILGPINQAFNALNACKDKWNEVEAIVEDFEATLYLEYMDIFDGTYLPASVYGNQNPWVWDILLNYYNVENKDYLSTSVKNALFFQLPFKVRQDLMLQWFMDHQTDVPYYSGIVFTQVDEAFAAILEVGWFSADTALELLFPAYGRISEAADALKDIVIVVDPRGELLP